jgi:hypothetical protein
MTVLNGNVRCDRMHLSPVFVPLAYTASWKVHGHYDQVRCRNTLHVSDVEASACDLPSQREPRTAKSRTM